MVARKKSVPRKKAVPQKKATRRKKTAPRKKAEPRKKAAPRKKVARRKKATSPKKTAPRKKATPRMKAAASDERQRMQTILQRLEKEYPDAKCSLDHENPLQLLIATILSAQCTDARVNQVTPQLFARYPTARDLAEADQGELEDIVRSTGFYRNKARNILACARELMLHHDGKVPDDLDSLVRLPGIGRKTANVVLGNAFDIPGLVVDTHVTRLSQLLRLTAQKDANKIEFDLMEVVPRAKWTELAHLFIEHGRKVCVARRPRCAACVLNDLCPSSEV